MNVVQTVLNDNWDIDWNDCEVMQPKKSRMRWCTTCHELHDLGCFFRFKGSWMGCFLNKSNRAKALAKIKGGIGSKKI